MGVPGAMGTRGCNSTLWLSSGVSAQSNMHSDRSPRILVGLRLVSTTTSLPISSSSL
ncbi:hypothetical protein D3C78_1809300 [compost metagenome]